VLRAAGWPAGLDPRKAGAMRAGEQLSAGNLTDDTAAAHDRGHRPVLHEHAELGDLRVRLIGILFIVMVGTILACLSSADFYSSFENFIGVLLFFFVPWSAINLVDYYLVKHGRYDLQSFFKPDGIYGVPMVSVPFATSLPSRYRYRSLISCFTSGRWSSRWAVRTSPGLSASAWRRCYTWRGRGASSTSSRGRRPRWVRRLKVSCGGGVS
jgi:hypothetical protein